MFDALDNELVFLEVFISEKHRRCLSEMASKQGILWGTLIERMIAQYQLVDENIFSLTPNLNHPTNQRLLKAPAND